MRRCCPGSAGGEAQLPDMAGLEGRPDQLHPRLPLCPLHRRRRGSGPGARHRACGRGSGPWMSRASRLCVDWASSNNCFGWWRPPHCRSSAARCSAARPRRRGSGARRQPGRARNERDLAELGAAGVALATTLVRSATRPVELGDESAGAGFGDAGKGGEKQCSGGRGCNGADHGRARDCPQHKRTAVSFVRV